MARVRCEKPSPYAYWGGAAPDIRKSCIRADKHQGPHRNRYWEWNDNDLEPRPRKDSKENPNARD